MQDRDESRSEAGQGGDDLVLVEELGADPQALRDHVLRQAAEISELRRQNKELRTFETLAVGCAEAVVQRSERLRKVL